MARRPADIVAAAPKPQGRDAVWAAIRRLGEGAAFTPRDIERETDVPGKTVRDYLAGLAAAGYLAAVASKPLMYALARDVGVEAPRVRKDGTEVTQGRGREQMWRTMKVMSTFTARDLAIHASTADSPVSQEDAKSYVGHLNRAGYLALVRQAKGGRPGQAQYRLLRSKNTGPKPPQIQRVKQVWDPNLQQVMWQGEGRDA